MTEYCTGVRNGNFCILRNRCKHYKGLLKVLSSTPINGTIPPYTTFEAPYIKKGDNFTCHKLSLVDA